MDVDDIIDIKIRDAPKRKNKKKGKICLSTPSEIHFKTSENKLFKIPRFASNVKLNSYQNKKDPIIRNINEWLEFRYEKASSNHN